MFELEFYATADGKEPVVSFLDSLDSKMNAKLIGLMELPEEKGPELRDPYSSPLGEREHYIFSSLESILL